MDRMEWGFAIFFVVFIVLIGFAMHWQFTAPCSDLGNLTISQLPARCLLK